MRSSLVLFLALAIQVLTSVATNPIPSTSTPATLLPRARKPKPPKQYHPGDMVMVKPSAWEGRNTNGGGRRPHPAVVVGKNPTTKDYKVVHISHNLPAHYPHRDNAHNYHNKADHHSQINTGTPKEVAGHHLRKAGAWGKMDPHKLNNLKTAINHNCPGANLRRRGVGCSGHKPNRNTAKGQSRKPQGNKAGPKPKGQVRQFKVGSKPNRKAPPSKARQLRGKKV